MFAGVEPDEMPRRERRTAAPAGELALADDDVALEADERTGTNPKSAVLAFDDAAFFGFIEDFARRPWIVRHGFEAVHRRREVEFVVFEMREECNAEFDWVVAHGIARSSVCLSVVRAASRESGRAATDRNGLVARAPDSCVSRTRRRFVGIAVVASMVALAALTISPDALVVWAGDLRSRPLAFGLVVAVVYLFRPLVAWPMSLCSAVVGYGYGLLGVPLALCGVCVTCLPPYLLGRYASGDVGVLGRLGGAGERFFERTGGIRGVAAARLAPLPADPVSVGAGLSGVPLRPYLLGTLVGEIPWTVAAVLAGRSLPRLAVSGLRGAGIELALAAGAVALLVLVGPASEYLRERRGAHRNVSERPSDTAGDTSASASRRRKV